MWCLDIHTKLEITCEVSGLPKNETGGCGLWLGTSYPHITWANVMLHMQFGCERWFNIEFYGTDSHFCHSAYITWSHMELWPAHTPTRLAHFCHRTHFTRHDPRVECSSDIVTSCFQKWRKWLLKKCANGPFYMTPSNQIIEISIWQPTHGKRQGRSWKWTFYIL